MEVSDDWATSEYRQFWVNRIASLAAESKNGVCINPEVLEREIFIRSNSRSEYLKYFAKLQHSIKNKLASLEAKQKYEQLKTEEPEIHQIKTESDFKVKTELEISNLAESFSALSRPPIHQKIESKAMMTQKFGEIDEIELKILEMQCANKDQKASAINSTAAKDYNCPINDLENLTLAPWNQKRTSLPTSKDAFFLESSKNSHTPTSNNLPSKTFGLNDATSQDENCSKALQNRAVLYTSKPISLPNSNTYVEQQKEFPTNVLFRSQCKSQSEAHQVASSSNVQQRAFVEQGPKVIATKISPPIHTFQSFCNTQQIQRSQSLTDLETGTISRVQEPQNIQNINRSSSMSSFQYHIGKINVVNVAHMKPTATQPVQSPGNSNSQMPRPMMNTQAITIGQPPQSFDNLSNSGIDSLKMPPPNSQIRPQSRQQIFPNYAQSTSTQSQSQYAAVGSFRGQNWSGHIQNQVHSNQSSALHFQTSTQINQNSQNEQISNQILKNQTQNINDRIQFTAKPGSFNNNCNQDTRQALHHALQETSQSQVMAQNHQNSIEQIETINQNSMTNNEFSMRTNTAEHVKNLLTNGDSPRNVQYKFDNGSINAQTNIIMTNYAQNMTQNNQTFIQKPLKVIQNSEQTLMEHPQNIQDKKNEGLMLQKLLAAGENVDESNKLSLNDQKTPQLKPESSDIVKKSEIRSVSDKTPKDQQDWREHARKSLPMVISILEAKAFEKFQTKDEYKNFCEEVLNFARDKLDGDKNNSSDTAPQPLKTSIHIVKTKNIREIENLLSNEREMVKKRVMFEWQLLDNQVQYLMNTMMNDGQDESYEKLIFPPDEFEFQTSQFIMKLCQNDLD